MRLQGRRPAHGYAKTACRASNVYWFDCGEAVLTPRTRFEGRSDKIMRWNCERHLQCNRHRFFHTQKRRFHKTICNALIKNNLSNSPASCRKSNVYSDSCAPRLAIEPETSNYRCSLGVGHLYIPYDSRTPNYRRSV